jgi:hypothetical protein
MFSWAVVADNFVSPGQTCCSVSANLGSPVRRRRARRARIGASRNIDRFYRQRQSAASSRDRQRRPAHRRSPQPRQRRTPPPACVPLNYVRRTLANRGLRRIIRSGSWADPATRPFFGPQARCPPAGWASEPLAYGRPPRSSWTAHDTHPHDRPAATPCNR